jgi:GNAT superfamily N-acetyltransferase
VLRVRPMTAADVPLGLRLREQAGWNQTEADWRRLLDLQPDGCFVAELDGAAAGTAAAFVFGPVAWVAMVLVEESLRGRGVGGALMRHALDFLDRQAVRTVRLDATPLGRPLYEKLGFVAEYTLLRYSGQAQRSEVGGQKSEVRSQNSEDTATDLLTSDLRPLTSEVCVVPATAAHLDGVVRLDRAVTGADRGRLLRRLFAEAPERWRVAEEAGEVTGYLTSRPGARAWQVGPCLGGSGAGPALLADAWRRHAGQLVFVDVPADHAAAVGAAEAQGLSVQRVLLRMGRGPAAGEDVGRLWASSGPEKG